LEGKGEKEACALISLQYHVYGKRREEKYTFQFVLAERKKEKNQEGKGKKRRENPEERRPTFSISLLGEKEKKKRSFKKGERRRGGSPPSYHSAGREKGKESIAGKRRGNATFRAPSSRSNEV